MKAWIALHAPMGLACSSRCGPGTWTTGMSRRAFTSGLSPLKKDHLAGGASRATAMNRLNSLPVPSMPLRPEPPS